MSKDLFEEQWDRLLEPPPSDLKLGTPDDGDDPLEVPFNVRAAHMHVIGQTRSGKSRFLADLIRQDIVGGAGLCLLDPHGELYDLTVNWLADNPFVAEFRPNIHPVRLTDGGSCLRFNPLHIDHPDEAYTVSANVSEAITRIYGGNDPTETPLLSFILDITCTILALRGLPLTAGEYFMLNGENDRELRDQIVRGVPDEYFRRLGEELSEKTPKEFRETVGSAGRRLHGFFRNPYVRRIFSTTENTLPLREIMDGKHVLLIDASDQETRKNPGKLMPGELRAIGSLLVNNLFGAARTRDPREKHPPFLLYIDEVQNFVNQDIEHILSQAGKRGLFLTLAHQTLAQLALAGEHIYSGVMSGTLLKAVFNIPMEEAEVFADQLFANEIDFERVKEKLAIPHVTGQELVLLRHQAQAEGTSESSAQTSSRGTSRSLVDGDSSGLTMQLAASAGLGLGPPGALSIGAPANGSFLSHSQGQSRVEGETTSFADGDAVSTSHQYVTSEGVSEAYRSIYETISTQTYSLEEQRYELRRRLALQPPRHGYIAIRHLGTRGFTTRDVPDALLIPEVEEELVSELRASSPWVSIGAELPAALTMDDIRRLVGGETKDEKEPEEPDDFMEEIN